MSFGRWAVVVLVAAGCTAQRRAVAEEQVALAPLPQAPRVEVVEVIEVSQHAPQERVPDVIFVPTPTERVKAMLELAQPKPGEKLYDLGCGDGRIAVAAARDYGAQAVCVDIDPERIREAQQNVAQNEVEDLVEVRQADLFEIDFSDADVVTLYLLPSLNEKLRPTLLRSLRPGARVVSHSFDMGSWQPDAELEVSGAKIYLWIIPE